MASPRVLILHATGINRGPDAAYAVTRAGGDPTILHVNELRRQPEHLQDYHMLVLPGGFSYGDALGAGRLWASDLRWLFMDQLARFVQSGRPVLGICNGFQALVKSGWLPGPPGNGGLATLTRNRSNHFECRWVWLKPNPDSACVFTAGLQEPIFCPVAHGEGRFVARDGTVLDALRANRQIALTYTTANGRPVGYPANPNGSIADIAGICNVEGNVLGLMPHPEDHVEPWQHPRWSRGERGSLGLNLIANGISYAARV